MFFKNRDLMRFEKNILDDELSLYIDIKILKVEQISYNLIR